jgi:hypothetical protein
LSPTLFITFYYGGVTDVNDSYLSPTPSVVDPDG